MFRVPLNYSLGYRLGMLSAWEPAARSKSTHPICTYITPYLQTEAAQQYSSWSTTRIRSCLQSKVQMSTKQVSKSPLGKLHKAHSSIWWLSNDVKIITVLLFCGFVPGSILYSQFNVEKVRLFLFLWFYRLVSKPPGRYKNCCLDSGPMTV